MIQSCPVCKEYITTIRKTEIECEICKSTIYSDENDNPKVIKSGMQFDIVHFIFALVYLCGGVYLIAMYFVENFRILYTGIIFTLAPIAGILRDFRNYDGIRGLFSAFIDKRIVHYDFGSKFAFYILFTILCLGLIFLIIGSLFKI